MRAGAEIVAAALGPSAPCVLRIAGDQISVRELAAVAAVVTEARLDLARTGSLEELAALIRRDRATNPAGEEEIFPRLQQEQYMHADLSRVTFRPRHRAGASAG